MGSFFSVDVFLDLGFGFEFAGWVDKERLKGA